MRRVVSGGFELGVPAEAAIHYFTPEGERAWAPGWNPIYVDGQLSEAPGTVFVTDAHGVDTIWLIHRIDRVACSAAYARVTPGHHAGTVHVQVANRGSEGCWVAVAYDMSLLPGADPAVMDAYDDEAFEAMMTHWAQAVGHHVSS